MGICDENVAYTVKHSLFRLMIDTKFEEMILQALIW